MKVTITLTGSVMEYLKGIIDRDGDLASDGVELKADDYASQIETLLEQMTW